MAASKAEFVLDSSAVLALLQAEPGHENIAERMGLAVISAVNYAEVVTSLINNGMQFSQAADLLAMVALDVVPFDVEQALQCGALRQATRDSDLSLGDRACLALAQHYRLTAITTDKTWTQVAIGVEVHFPR